MTLDKAQRIALLISRLEALPRASSGREMLAQLSATMHAIENEHSGVPANPNAADALVDDGRMYPPDERFLDPIAGRPDIARYRHRKGTPRSSATMAQSESSFAGSSSSTNQARTAGGCFENGHQATPQAD